jgi:hypothetical protein
VANRRIRVLAPEGGGPVKAVARVLMRVRVLLICSGRGDCFDSCSQRRGGLLVAGVFVNSRVRVTMKVLV